MMRRMPWQGASQGPCMMLPLLWRLPCRLWSKAAKKVRSHVHLGISPHLVIIEWHNLRMYATGFTRGLEEEPG